MTRFSHVFSELTIKGRTIKNRIQYAPMVPNLATSAGECGIELADFVEQQAKTGAGYIIIGDTQIDHEHARCFEGELRVDEDRFITGLYKMTEAAHRYGALIGIELSHAGAGANPAKSALRALSPSGVAIPSPACSPSPRAMDRADMDMVRDKWAECARRCVAAGFDIIMIHSAHQNLLCEFLSPATNTRTDIYGGSLENRMRFPLEVIRAIRAAVGGKIILEMRVSGREEVPGGLTEDEVIAYAQQAQKYIDILHVSRGSVFNPAGLVYNMPNHLRPARLNADIAEKFKKALIIPVAVPGNIFTVEDAEDILASGKADIVAMARSLMADPLMIKNALWSHTEKTRPCIRCLECAGNVVQAKPIRCAVNPMLGLETYMKMIRNPEERKKVVIVGGGPSGMMAAQACRGRGHDVVLFEKSYRLGGLMHDAASLESKYLLKRYKEWDIETTLRCGADIRLNTEVTVEIVCGEKPDAVILATGSRYVFPDIPGIHRENVFQARDVDNKRVAVGKNVVVCGAGLTGIECADDLARKGHQVTLIDKISEEDVASGVSLTILLEILENNFKKNNVHILGNYRIVEFQKDGVVVETPDGTRRIEMDSAVIALGVTPYNPLEEKIREIYPLATYVVGDCTGRGDIRKANQDGFFAALDI